MDFAQANLRDTANDVYRQLADCLAGMATTLQQGGPPDRLADLTRDIVKVDEIRSNVEANTLTDGAEKEALGVLDMIQISWLDTELLD